MIKPRWTKAEKRAPRACRANSRPRPPTRRQREIVAAWLKTKPHVVMEVISSAEFSLLPLEVERAIRACLVWGGRRG